jgi:peptidoglycan hydrolase-like protein with peptidoglycan-binding domain
MPNFSVVPHWRLIPALLAALLGGAIPVLGLAAQQRVLLPEGTVINVMTRSVLSSTTAREGDTFRTAVSDSVRVEGFTVIPEGSIIDGVITLARRASERQSGVIGVAFTSLQLPNGGSVAIDGKLTSTDPSERRQIDAQPNAQVLFVGGRRGAGAAIGAVGSSGSTDAFANVLGTLGTLLSKGADVNVPVNTKLAVQLERGIAMRVTGTEQVRRSDAYTIYTSAEAIRTAQSALRQKGYYRGSADGTLNEATQRALVEFQIDNGIIVTGNLDGRTAEALNLQLAGGVGGLTPNEATLLRRNAQVLTTRYRDALGVSQSGRLDPRRFYASEEIELYFALSAFADNASLYEQMSMTSGNVEGLTAAGDALIDAARRVDVALRATRVAARIATSWGVIQQDLAQLDSAYPER